VVALNDARAVLATLASFGAGVTVSCRPRDLVRNTKVPSLVAWLARHDLAGLAFATFRATDPDLTDAIKPAALGAAAANLAHFATLARIDERFAAEGIAFVVLKGAAVASTAYRDPSLRSMTDLDLWVRDEAMQRASDALSGLGFRLEAGLPHRPRALQEKSRGELVFRSESGAHGLVELHFGAFQGWWARRTANPDDDGLWSRAVPLGPGRTARGLAPEDATLQIAFHVAVNQFGQAPLRGLMDLSVLARAFRLDWHAIAERAAAWRLATVTWLVLDLANETAGLPGCEPALERLRPARSRRAVLSAFMSPEALLAGRVLTAKSRRHAFMAALVDRPADGARLVARTIWPEPWWIAARYGRPMSRARHLWGLVRRREA
jgi:hypothetical protein